MSSRELVVLGTASQTPTRYRNHNGYLLRWDGEGVLFDPGEGTQRQMILAGVSASQVTRICITHFHGDHCLGLPGVLQRISLDGAAEPVEVYFPESGAEYLERLRHAAIFQDRNRLVLRPVAETYSETEGGPFRLYGRRLEHSVHSVGWRIEERDGIHMLADRLAERGVQGPDVGRLIQEGSLMSGDRLVRVEEVSEPRRGQVFAFVMDTRLCDAAFELARGADLLVSEATFLSSESDLAREYGHMTAGEAARLAKEAGARRLVLTHFSQRHPDPDSYLEEARAVFEDVVVASDLDVVPVPPRP
jgi:ribonuclease Z